MKVFIDTSGIYSFLDASDQFHERAHERMQALRNEEAILYSHDYIFVESVALIQNRLGMKAVTDFYRTFWPMVHRLKITEHLRNRAMEFLIGRGSRSVSFVDAVSFLCLKEEGIERVFGFDSDFEKEGYNLLS